MLEFIKKQNTEHLIIYVNPTASYSRVQSTTQRGRCCHACPSPTTALPHCPTTCNNFGSTTALTRNKFVIMKNRHFLVYTTPKRLVLFCSSFLIFLTFLSLFFVPTLLVNHHAIDGEIFCLIKNTNELITILPGHMEGFILGSPPCGLALFNKISTEDKHGNSTELQ